jgi:hypothetical protein
MGMDFIRRAAPGFHKGLDQMRIKLATPTLFTQEPESKPRVYAAQLRDDRTATCGEKLGIRLDGEQVHALRGLDLIATFNSPTPEVREALQASHGEGCGEVQTIHIVAGVVEITLC